VHPSDWSIIIIGKVQFPLQHSFMRALLPYGHIAQAVMEVIGLKTSMLSPDFPFFFI